MRKTRRKQLAENNSPNSSGGNITDRNLTGRNSEKCKLAEYLNSAS